MLSQLNSHQSYDSKCERALTEVTLENVKMAETTRYALKFRDLCNGVNKIYHLRTVDSLVNTVVRMNMDTLYSCAVIDCSLGNVVITIPPYKYYQSMAVIDMNHFIVNYLEGPGSITFTNEKYEGPVIILLRTFLNNPDEAHLAQDGVTITGPHFATHTFTDFNQKSLDKIRKLVSELASTDPSLSSDGMFGSRDSVDSLKHFIGTIVGWGGLPVDKAKYISVTPSKNDGHTEYRLIIPQDIPVRAFWSVTLYDNNGDIVNDHSSLNSVTATVSDGKYIINFTADSTKENNLLIFKGWNYTFRLYNASEEILNGIYCLPTAERIF